MVSSFYKLDLVPYNVIQMQTGNAAGGLDKR